MLTKMNQRIDQWVARLTIKQSILILSGYLLAVGGYVTFVAFLVNGSWFWSALAGSDTRLRHIGYPNAGSGTDASDRAMCNMNQFTDDNQLTPREEKVWQFYQQGRDTYWIAEQFHQPVAVIAKVLLEIQRKLQNEKEREA